MGGNVEAYYEAMAEKERYEREQVGAPIKIISADSRQLAPSDNGFVTHDGEVVAYDPTDPASLEAFFGNFGHAEHFRKVVLASAREAVRAEYALKNEKVTESRLDDLARVHPKYVDWLTYTLTGRHLREKNVLESAAR